MSENFRNESKNQKQHDAESKVNENTNKHEFSEVGPRRREWMASGGDLPSMWVHTCDRDAAGLEPVAVVNPGRPFCHHIASTVPL